MRVPDALKKNAETIEALLEGNAVAIQAARRGGKPQDSVIDLAV